MTAMGPGPLLRVPARVIALAEEGATRSGADPGRCRGVAPPDRGRQFLAVAIARYSPPVDQMVAAVMELGSSDSR